MARRRKRKFNPTGLETALLAAGTALVGGMAGFWLASVGCARLLQAAVDTGQIQPGPNAGPIVGEALQPD